MNTRFAARFFVLAFVLLLMLVGASLLQAQDDDEAEDFDHLHITTNYEELEFMKIEDMSAEEAEEAGYVALSECVPGMGYHYAMMGEEGPEQPILVYDASGEMIGIEFESLTEQPSPWEHLEEGHEGMEFEHWTLHIYWTHEPELACEEAE